MQMPIEWLLEGESWIAYRTRRDLLGQPKNDPETQASRRGMLGSPQVKALMAELALWPRMVIVSHKSAGQPFHKLTFLADLGFLVEDPGIDVIVKRICEQLKVPFVWYDIMHVLDVLSRFEWLNSDRRLLEMLDIVKSNGDREGRFAPGSFWTAWKGWELGQRKVPSRWLTLLVWRMMRRIEAVGV